MTATKKELRQAFGNGMLPSGQDFSDLIDFMLPEATFDAHVQAFNTWKSRPEISFGTGAEAWVLKAHEDGNRLSLSPGNLPLPDGAGDLVLGAVVQIGARTGGALAAGAFAAGGAVTGMDPEAMQTLPADGKWHDVVLPPARAVAFEITAFAPAPPARPEGSLRRILRRVTGDRKSTRLNSAQGHRMAGATGCNPARHGHRHARCAGYVTQHHAKPRPAQRLGAAAAQSGVAGGGAIAGRGRAAQPGGQPYPGRHRHNRGRAGVDDRHGRGRREQPVA